MEKLLWTLFTKTGDVKYYLLYNKLRGENEKSSSRGNNLE